MSWLSRYTTPLWRMFKGGRTDAQTVFGLVVDRMSASQRIQLRINMNAVAQAIAIAALAEPNSTQVKRAQEWIDGAAEALQ